jgi:hypothetical protein
LKKVKESKQSDDLSKQQSSGNYGNYNRGSYRGRFNTYQGHEVRGRSRKVNNKVQVTMVIIIEVHIEVDLIHIKDMK